MWCELLGPPRTVGPSSHPWGSCRAAGGKARTAPWQEERLVCVCRGGGIPLRCRGQGGYVTGLHISVCGVCVCVHMCAVCVCVCTSWSEKDPVTQNLRLQVGGALREGPVLLLPMKPRKGRRLARDPEDRGVLSPNSPLAKPRPSPPLSPHTSCIPLEAAHWALPRRLGLNLCTGLMCSCSSGRVKAGPSQVPALSGE